MKRTPSLFLFVLMGSLSGVSASEDAPAPERTQVIQLNKGWNAVFLEVEPNATEPSEVFTGKPIDTAANYSADSAPDEQFISDTAINLTKARGWALWYAKEKPEAFLSTLGAIYGRQAYLIHAKTAFRWEVTGRVLPVSVKWRPDSFNLVGFGVKAQGAPSFSEYFAGSAAHRSQPIYRLVDGNWRKVTNPDAEPMRSGEAFWIYCKGGSSYQGPLGVELPGRLGIVLTARGNQMVLRNQTDHPVTPTLERVACGASELPLSITITAYGDTNNPVKQVALEKPTAPWTQAIPPLETGKALAVPLEARTGEMTAVSQACLLKITTDMGTECWVPVTGMRGDLKK